MRCSCVTVPVHRSLPSLGLLCAVFATASFAGCANRSSNATAVAPSVAAEPTNDSTPGPETVTLRYSAEAARFSQQAAFGSKIEGGIMPDSEHSLMVHADIVREPVARGASLQWQVTSLRDTKTNDQRDVAGLVGELVLDVRGQRLPLPDPIPAPSTEGEDEGEHEGGLADFAQAAFPWPVLPSQGLVPGESLTLDGNRQIKLGEVEFEVATHVEYTLLDYEPGEGTATLHILGWADGTADYGGSDAELSQTSETTVYLDLEHGAPTRWTHETDQHIDMAGDGLAVIHKMDVRLHPPGEQAQHEGPSPIEVL